MEQTYIEVKANGLVSAKKGANNRIPYAHQKAAMENLDIIDKESAYSTLVVLPTGAGKTYTASLWLLKHALNRKKKILWIAHRQMLLDQAAESFQKYAYTESIPNINSFRYRIVSGSNIHDRTIDILNSDDLLIVSKDSLGRNLESLDKWLKGTDEIYLVVDEFHHAVNDQYQRIVNYFKPQFLLGLTATPERMDGKNIYEICDYNVPYEISLKEAINKGVLVPFHYYGIYDETDYSSLQLVKGHYDAKELNDTYIGNVKRYDLIYKYYMKYRSKRALGFCCSRQHAEEMAKEFCKRGIESVAVYSNADGEFSEDRDKAIEKLKNQEIRVIFSVDMFNEGVDIAALDMVMFLRPTESPIVFLQQLGRGLRTSKGKEYLNVLDFIGNYEKAGRAQLLLSGGKSFGEKTAHDYNDIEYPDDCIVDFDMRLIDLFKELDKKTVSVKERIKQEFYRVKELLDGKVPSRMELFTYMDDGIYQYCIKHAKENPFRRYMEFLNEMQVLSAEEKAVYQGTGREFLSLIETTDMQKVYKMPILYSFYNDGNIRLAVKDEEVLVVWKKFFDNGMNWKDFAADISYADYKAMTDKQHLSKAKSMPIKFLKSSGKGFFIEKEGYAIAIRDELEDVIGNEAFKKHMNDILEYRTMEYYRRRYTEKVF
ncbi:DEAD/DEAH box helicase [Velocimicrobium porci]|uniref:DEAD/DEAH box helicase n=1 Tax=Velocimicrobium porci TaxID=2606634 RepID=A0A6L5Y0V2_9FIRM|nr:DEAD/DEAH box helicase [Velocimicrobium porci]MSS64735.1 DEAD/DEAH box helicase [Velocimicrobium porci]